MEMEIEDNCIKTECWFLDGCRQGYCLLSIFSCLLSLSRLPSLGEAIADLNGFYTKIKHSEVVCGLLLDMDLVFSPLPFTSWNLLFFPVAIKEDCWLLVQLAIVIASLRYKVFWFAIFIISWGMICCSDGVFLLSKRSVGIFFPCCISSWSCWIWA